MKEIGLLFSPPMARAMVRPVNPKTQTRRLPAAHNCLVDGYGMSAKRWAAMQFDWATAWVDGGDCIKVASLNPDNHGTVHRIYPRAEPGDVVWGRETWQGPLLEEFESDADPDWNTTSNIHQYQNTAHVVYAADGGPCPEFIDADDNLRQRWRSAIHMPRWAARIVRPIVRMRFERLQDISEADARAEGARECDPVSGREVLLAGPSQRGSFVLHYRDIWEQINGPTSWDTNPIVLVYEFGAPTP